LLEKVTVPEGGLWVPAAVSVTVAVQVVDNPAVTGLGEQLTWLLVPRNATPTPVVLLEATKRCSGRFGGECHRGSGMMMPVQQR
jgi:hypothetical protein